MTCRAGFRGIPLGLIRGMGDMSGNGVTRYIPHVIQNVTAKNEQCQERSESLHDSIFEDCHGVLWDE